jgi:hypothetical protein
MSYICLADGQLGIQWLSSSYCYFTYFIVLARHYAPFFRLSNNYLCLYQCFADLQVKRVPSINMYTFFHVCMLLAVVDYIPRTRRVPRSSFVTFLVQAKELHIKCSSLATRGLPVTSTTCLNTCYSYFRFASSQGALVSLISRLPSASFCVALGAGASRFPGRLGGGLQHL